MKADKSCLHRIMGKKEIIEDRTYELLEPVAKAHGCIPVDAEYVKNTGEYSLLVYIDKEEGVTIDDCEAVSRALEEKLDLENFISDPYTLVVSSPGLGREIRRPRDFDFAKGREVLVKTYAKVKGDKEFTGILKSFDQGSICLETENEELTLDKKDVAKINLTFEI